MKLAALATAKTFQVGPLLDADGVAVTAAKTATDVMKVTKNGVVDAADAQDTMTHSHTGHYTYVTDGGDFDELGEVEFSLNDGTTAMQPVKFQVVPVKVYNSLVLGSDYLEVDTQQWFGTGTAISGSGYPQVDTHTLRNQALTVGAGVTVGTYVGGTAAAAIQTDMDKVPKSDGAVRWNSTALADIESEANDALVALNLDHLLAVACPGNVITGAVVDFSVIAWIADDAGDISAYTPAASALQGLFLNQGDVLTGIQTDIPALIATAQTDLNTITGTAGVLIGSDATLPANIITTASINTGAFTADAFAANALVAATFAADCITEAKIADNAIAAEHIAVGAIDNATFAPDVGSTAYATNIIALAARKAINDYAPSTHDAAAVLSALGTGTWLTNPVVTDADSRTASKATGFSIHDAAAVLTALGDGTWATEAGGDGDHLTAIPGGDATAANQVLILEDIVDMKGTEFAKDTDSMVNLAHIGADADTLETLSDQLDTLSALSGDGAYTGTLTVDDGATGLEGAIVNARVGGVLKASGTTNASGQITDWVFGAFTYDFAVRLAGYEPATDSLAISANAWTNTISLTAITITAPSSPSLCTVQFQVLDGAGAALEGAICKAQLQGNNQGTDGTVLSTAELTDTTDATGVAELELVRLDSIEKGTGVYSITVEVNGDTIGTVKTTIPNQATVLFEDLLP